MGGLAHYFEEEGVPTTQISLIRLHTEKMNPPRALWVPFELGRPLGAPNDPLFQTKVLLAALKLLETPAGPVLADFPEDAPPAQAELQGWACPVDFSPAGRQGGKEELDLPRRFRDEVKQMGTWYELALKNKGRTTVGASGLTPEEIADLLASFLKGDVPANPRPGVEFPWLIKLASEDLKAFYLEGLSAQPGFSDPGSKRLEDWFWAETAAGGVYLALAKVFSRMSGDEYGLLAKLLLVPRSQAHRLKD